MLYYVIFALVAVSTCTGDNPATAILTQELSDLYKLMGSIEQRIETVAKNELSSLTNASVTCWAIHLAGFKSAVQNSYNNTLSEIRGQLQTKLDQSSGMTPSQLDELEGELSDSDSSSLTNRLTALVEEFIKTATSILNELNRAQSFTCSS